MKISRERIELLQAQRKISSKRFSELAGMSRQMISAVKVRGTCHPTTAAKLARGVGVQISEIIEKEV